MLKVLVPKISRNHVLNEPNFDDYFLGCVDLSIDEILNYNNNTKKIDFIYKTNSLESNNFAFLSKLLDTRIYYVNPMKNYSENKIISSILLLTSPKFSLMKNKNDVQEYIDKFRQQLAIDLDEKGLFKSLKLSEKKIRKKLIQELLLKLKENLDVSPDLIAVLKYICFRFSLGLIIVKNDGSFHEIALFPDRLNMVICQNETNFMPLMDKENNSNLFSYEITSNIIKTLKANIVNLKSMESYKVDELKIIAKKVGLNGNVGTKAQVYELIKNYLKIS
jgi:hypothetical protein